MFNRRRYVSFNSVESSKQTMKFGIPQGSSPGALLFLLYITDISNFSDKLNFTIFADDTNVFASSPSIRDLEKPINEELQSRKPITWLLNPLKINQETWILNYQIKIGIVTLLKRDIISITISLRRLTWWTAFMEAPHI